MLLFGGQSFSPARARLCILIVNIYGRLISNCWRNCSNNPRFEPALASRRYRVYCFTFLLQKCRELFPSELAQFQVYSYIQDFVLSENGASSITRQRLDPWESINRIGEGERVQSSSWIYSKNLPVITKQTPLLEVLMGRGEPLPHLWSSINFSCLIQYPAANYLGGFPDYPD